MKEKTTSVDHAGVKEGITILTKISHSLAPSNLADFISHREIVQ